MKEGVGRSFELRRGGGKVVFVSPLYSPLRFVEPGEELKGSGWG